MLSFFPRGVLDEILNLIESVSEEFPSYSSPFTDIFLRFCFLSDKSIRSESSSSFTCSMC